MVQKVEVSTELVRNEIAKKKKHSVSCYFVYTRISYASTTTLQMKWTCSNVVVDIYDDEDFARFYNNITTTTMIYKIRLPKSFIIPGIWKFITHKMKSHWKRRLGTIAMKVNSQQSPNKENVSNLVNIKTQFPFVIRAQISLIFSVELEW